MRKAWWREGLWGAGLVGLGAAIFSPIVMGREAWFWQDIWIQNLPLHVWSQEAWKEGVLRFWCHEVGGGFPLFAEGQAGVLYWPRWLVMGLEPWWGYSLLVWAHWIWAGLGTFVYLRSMGFQPLEAWSSGFLVAFSGWFVGHTIHSNMLYAAAWFPWLLWAMDQRAVRATLWGGLIWGTQWWAGYPQMPLYAFLWGVLYRMVVATDPRRGRRALPLREAGVGWLGCGAVGGLLGAMQTLPTLELALHSVRGEGFSFEAASQIFLDPKRLWVSLAPLFFGVPYTKDYWGPPLPWEYNAHLGVVALGLIGVSLWLLPPSRWKWFFLASFLLPFLMAWGEGNRLYRLLWLLPGFRWIRGPARLLLLSTLSGAFLAGGALNRWLQGQGRCPAWVVMMPWVLFWGGVAITIRAVQWVDWSPLLPNQRAWLVKAWLLFLGGWLWLGLLMVGREVWPRRGSLWAWLAVAGMGAEGVLTALPFHPLMERPALTSFSSRRLRPIEGRVWAPPYTHPEAGANTNLLYHLANFSLYSPLALQAHQRWEGRLREAMEKGEMAIASHLLRVASVEVVVKGQGQRPSPFPGVPGVSPLWRPLNPPLPWMRLAHKGRQVRDAEEALRALMQGEGERVVLVEGLPSFEGPMREGEDCHAFWLSANRWEGKAKAMAPGVLTWAETFYPGWRVWVDGELAVLHRVNGLFTGVWLEAGEHRVQAVFAPNSVRVGGFLTLLGVALVAAWGRAVRKGG